MEKQKLAIVLGATGLTGSHLVPLLLESDQYHTVKVLVRHKISLIHSKLEQHIVNFDNLDDFKELIIGDHLFCCLGTTIKKAGSQEAFAKVDLDYPVSIAKIAIENGVSHFLSISSIGANAQSSNFYLRTKGLCEEHLKNIGFTSLSIFRPSLLLGERAEKRIAERLGAIFSKVFSFLLLGSLKKYKPIEAKKVAYALLRVASLDIIGTQVYESDQIRNS